MLEWTYAGINYSAKNIEDGGIECAAYSTLRQRFFETILTTIIASCETYYATTQLGTSFPCEYAREQSSVLRRLVLVFYSLLWGIEIGFKIVSRQFIYILNPCHVVTLIQVNESL